MSTRSAQSQGTEPGLWFGGVNGGSLLPLTGSGEADILKYASPFPCYEAFALQL